MTRSILTIMAGAALIAAAGTANANEEGTSNKGTPEILGAVDVAAYQRLGGDEMAEVVGTSYYWTYGYFNDRLGWHTWYPYFQNGYYYYNYFYYDGPRYQAYGGRNYEVPPQAAYTALYQAFQAPTVTPPTSGSAPTGPASPPAASSP